MAGAPHQRPTATDRRCTWSFGHGFYTHVVHGPNTWKGRNRWQASALHGQRGAVRAFGPTRKRWSLQWLADSVPAFGSLA